MLTKAKFNSLLFFYILKRRFKTFNRYFIIISILSLLFVSCNKKLDEYYETPDWLKGSIYEVLEKRGNYSIFLKGVVLTGMKNIVNGKSILTVMAPNDSAFTKFLNENYQGKKLEELPKEEISKIIGFHILYYSFSKRMLINFRPSGGDGESEESQNYNAGLYYKFRTKSMDGITTEKDTSGTDVSVYHLERFLPVFSYRMFQTKQIDAKYNYEYFFPQTPWKHNNGFNVANASVNEYAIIADNGYVYTIDRVLRPLETIYKELAYDESYSDFLKLYNAYEYYRLDENLTLNYGNGTNLYQHYHSAPLANIASEWPVTDYRMINQLSYQSYSIFAPNNDALNSFFNDYWKVGGYDSLYEVSKTSLNYLLFNCVYSSSIVFPEEIKKGNIINSYGTVIKFDVDMVPEQNRKICVNGALYGLDFLTPPSMFGSVTGPAFQYKKFSNFLDWISNSDLELTLSTDQTRFIMLYPSNELMASYGIEKLVNGTNVTYRKGTQTISASAQQSYVFAHVVGLDGTTGSYTSLPTTGTHVMKTLSPSMNLYWYLKDGKITNSIKFNELLYIPGITEDDIFSDVTELTFRDGWTNGRCYSYENASNPYLMEGSQANAINGAFIPMMLNNRNQSSTPYYGFVQVLDKAGLIDLVSLSVIPVIESCLMFVPTTLAIKNGILSGKIPGINTTSTDVNDPNFFINCTVTNSDTLQYYMLQYFIPLSTAIISNFPYVGWEENIPNGLPSLQTQEIDLGDGKVDIKTTKMTITDANGKVSIRALDSNSIPISNWVDVVEEYYYFPFVFGDGCVHFIKNVL